ncbi:MAG: tRNA (guanosine(37)-N1)-methyltransferase TrmD [Candidatus Omnitrophota bacterium]
MEKGPLYIDIVTLFPNFFKSPLQESIIKIAQKKKAVAITVHNVRDYTVDLHRTCDDKPFGGGPGMIMKPEPIFKCVEMVRRKRKKSCVIYLTPQGERLSQKKLKKLSQSNGFILLCGHYEGVDQRVRDYLVDEELSIGDFVLTGGETPALCLIDGIVRLIPGVLGNNESLKRESFQNNCLDHPHYTRPRTFRTYAVPEVLVSGNHRAVEMWRQQQSLLNTKTKRKDLLVNKSRKKGH